VNDKAQKNALVFHVKMDQRELRTTIYWH